MDATERLTEPILSKQCLLIPALWGDFNLGLERTLSLIADGLIRRGHSVDVAVRKPIDLDKVRTTFGAKLEGVRVRHVASWGKTAKTWPLVGRRLAGFALRRGFKQLTAEYDFVLVQNSYIPPGSAAKRSVLFTEFPRDSSPSSFDWQRRLGSYDLLIGNSQFTCSWIDRYWGHPCDVFYPSIQECRPLKKEPIILGVGRFTRGGREKGQLEMVKTFRSMVDKGLSGWKLQLAGLAGSQEYLDEVQALSQGYPVDIALSPTAEQLAIIYGKASLFWHTTGFGVDQQKEPQRLEHFGIVVAEAMTAGCVPLVFDAAGPREIVASDALCWTSLEELESKTLGLIEDPERMASLAKTSRLSAVERFGIEVFDRSVDRLLGE